ncbi:hypothetical protein [Maribacter sp. LLG6340-A2]|uniref:hypothetical protein n=1 Tax=Maribacter sp. LLG6340-A2 TaxID=3160834 RepID=UPI0038706E52
MKLIYIKRQSIIKELYRTKTGRKNSKVTSITKYFLGIPIQKIHSYRQVYHKRKNNAIEKMLFI